MEFNELLELVGTVDDIIYTNEENGYTVLTLMTDSGSSITVTGCMPFAAPGEKLIVTGVWSHHPSHGQQFKAEFIERHLPEGAEAIYEYLAGRVLKGVGPATASLIVTAFGDKSLEVIENQPERLAELRGITLKKACEISESLKKQLGLRRLMEFLAGHSIKPKYAMRLFALYGDGALEAIHNNPYILSMPLVGADFSEADALALELGLDGDCLERVSAAILFELQHNSGNGHVFIPREKLIIATAQLIDISVEPVEVGLDNLIASGKVVLSQIAGCDGCYLSELYDAETYIAGRIKAMAAEHPNESADISNIIDGIQRELNITYAPLQLKTLEAAAASMVTVITGGPGTGKTTTVRALLAMFDRLGLKSALAAPTGRAAKRMTELSGRDASTVHRLLEAGYAPGSFDIVFKHDEENPLKCDVVILDECSMMDVLLMRALLAALPDRCRLILVGDADQLPSVGPGNVFNDIIRSDVAPVIRLTEIFRQTAQSRIVSYAHMINSGEHPDISANKGDFFFMRRLSPEAASELTVQLCSKRLPDNMGIKQEDIQVLTPTRKGVTGTYNLNAMLQAALNPPSPEKKERKFGDFIFREGDRVMQIRNNYDIMWTSKDKTSAGIGVFNGDIGYIVSIDTNRESLLVDFDGRLAAYGFESLQELEHAWAMTVHKSQGSEYRAVILCVSGAPQQLLYRGVLYTAVTRARELLIITGDDNAVLKMIDNHKQARRYSGLRARLVEN